MTPTPIFTHIIWVKCRWIYHTRNIWGVIDNCWLMTIDQQITRVFLVLLICFDHGAKDCTWLHFTSWFYYIIQLRMNGSNSWSFKLNQNELAQRIATNALSIVLLGCFDKAGPSLLEGLCKPNIPTNLYADFRCFCISYYLHTVMWGISPAKGCGTSQSEAEVWLLLLWRAAISSCDWMPWPNSAKLSFSRKGKCATQGEVAMVHAGWHQGSTLGKPPERHKSPVVLIKLVVVYSYATPVVDHQYSPVF